VFTGASPEARQDGAHVLSESVCQPARVRTWRAGWRVLDQLSDQSKRGD